MGKGVRGMKRITIALGGLALATLLTMLPGLF